MTPTETVVILRQFNDWRRDFDDKVEQPDPREIGEVIDSAIAMIERLEAAEKEVTHIKEVEFPRKMRAVAVGWETKFARLEQERDELRAKIETAENDAAHQKALAASALRVAKGWEDKCNALRARIEKMEKQEPLWFIDERGEPKRYHKSKADYCKYGGLDLLYALPGAKGE